MSKILSRLLGASVLLAVLFSISGCQGQSRREALEIICETPNHVDMSGSEPFAVLGYIGEEVENQEVLEWYRHIGEDPDVDYAQQLRDMARAEGIQSCSFAEHLTQSGSTGSATRR